MSSQQQFFESLERAVNEIDALAAIYGIGDNDDDVGSSFSVMSTSELEVSRSIIEDISGGEKKNVIIPQLEVKVYTCLEVVDDEKVRLVLHCRLRKGYPELEPALVSASVEGLRRLWREEISSNLNKKAESMIGSEVLMELVEELKALAPSYLAREKKTCTKLHNSPDEETCDTFGRRWIWVHHIKDSDRRRSIVSEARELKLGGYLKSGFPGIIVIEGYSSACDEFVSWVKGNKSRPGGFGRNWGHHVRGHVNFPLDGPRHLTVEFEELEELAVMGGLCREHGLEDEFLEYVMQHKGGSS